MTFNIYKTINYWIESAEYDFETGKSLLESKKFPFEARYPDEKRDFYQKCSEEFTTKKVDEMYEVYQWLKKKLNE